MNSIREWWVSLPLIVAFVLAVSGCAIETADSNEPSTLVLRARDSSTDTAISGAAITLDNVLRSEQTPAVLSGLESGPHQVSIRPQETCYRTLDTLVQLEAAETLDVELLFLPGSDPGYCFVNTLPIGAEIIVDQQFAVRRTPAELTLAQGSHHISVYKEGFATLSPPNSLLTVSAQTRDTLTFELEQGTTGIFNGLIAPDFSLLSDLGIESRLASCRGMVLLLNFAGFRCSPCLAELPDLQAVYEEYCGEGFRILVINVGWFQETAEDFARVRGDFGLSFPLLFDGEGDESVVNRYGIDAAPTNILIDRTGRIHSRFGKTTAEELAALLQDLL